MQRHYFPLFSSKTLTANWLNETENMNIYESYLQSPKRIFFTIQYEQMVEEF